MIFNSFEFVVFIFVVFFLFWFVTNKSIRYQNILIIGASYLFYGWWDWRFLSLIIFSTLLDFSIGVLLGSENRLVRRKTLLWISLFYNLGLLAVFKYFNFFITNFTKLIDSIGIHIDVFTLEILLPVGISFYTFQTLSYTIDVYRKQISVTTDLFAFGAFVAFFPQLVVGPIERVSNLLPQFSKPKVFSQSLVDSLLLHSKEDDNELINLK
jgi:alginate O-acetyltransferase complex protein AlgI